MIIVDWLSSRELKVGHLSTIPTRVLGAPLQRRQLTEASFEHESLLFALPQEVFILFGEGAQELVLFWVCVDDVLRIVLDGFAVCEEARPHGGPAGMIDLLLRDIGADSTTIYSKTQSSYCSISFMQGVVSNTGGTEAGQLPKYRNDINIISTPFTPYLVQKIG